MKKNADGRCAALAKKGDATGKKSQYEITMQRGIISMHRLKNQQRKNAFERSCKIV